MTLPFFANATSRTFNLTFAKTDTFTSYSGGYISGNIYSNVDHQIWAYQNKNYLSEGFGFSQTGAVLAYFKGEIDAVVFDATALLAMKGGPFSDMLSIRLMLLSATESCPVAMKLDFNTRKVTALESRCAE